MRALALTLETIAKQASTEGKVQAAAAYLASQEPARIGCAARFLAGTPLPPGAPATKVGHSTLVDLVSAFAGRDRRSLLQLATQRGDLGEAVAELLDDMPRARTGPLGLEEVAPALAALGEVSGAARSQLLRDLITRCTPLEAKYLTKLLLGALRTGMQAGRVEEAIALAFDQPLSQVRRAHMLLGELGGAAERAAADTLESLGLEALRPVRMMLAHAGQDTDSVAQLLSLPVIAEDKYDGIRAQVHLVDGEVRLYSRALEDFTHFFPEVRQSPPSLEGEWILDGEVAAWVDGRALSFATLQQRLGRNQVPLTLLLDAPVIFLAFDVLRADSRDLIDAPLRRRKEVLEQVPIEGPVRRAPWALLEAPADLRAFFRAALERGNEGAVFKAPDSPYRPGTRGRAWVKVKRPTDCLDVVVTGAEYGAGKRAGLLSDLLFAVRDGEDFCDAGRAYSGLTEAEIRDLTAILKQTTIGQDGPVRRVEPSVVLEVTFDEVRASDRHPSGYALRFPRIVRWRHDLKPGDISTLSDLAQLASVHGGRG